MRCLMMTYFYEYVKNVKGPTFDILDSRVPYTVIPTTLTVIPASHLSFPRKRESSVDFRCQYNNYSNYNGYND